MIRLVGGSRSSPSRTRDILRWPSLARSAQYPNVITIPFENPNPANPSVEPATIAWSTSEEPAAPGTSARPNDPVQLPVASVETGKENHAPCFSMSSSSGHTPSAEATAGTGDTKSPLYISIISQIFVPLGLCFVIQQTSTLDPIDIWAAILAGHATRCVLSVIRFKQGKWRNIAVGIHEKR